MFGNKRVYISSCDNGIFGMWGVIIVVKGYFSFEYFEFFGMSCFGFCIYFFVGLLKGLVDFFGEDYDEGWEFVFIGDVLCVCKKLI